MFSETNTTNVINSHLASPWQNNPLADKSSLVPLQLSNAKIPIQPPSNSKSPLNFWGKAATIAPAAVTSGPDLLINSLTTTTPVVPVNGVATFTYRIKNEGTIASGGNTTAYYLSKDNLIDGNDTLIGNDVIGGIAVGAEIARTNSFGLSAALDPGDYNILAVADNGKVITEMTEDNNVSPAVAIKITKPDLTISNYTFPNILVAGGTGTFTYRVTNSGSARASATTTRFYLSTNPATPPDPINDSFVADDAVIALNPGTWVDRNVTLRIPETFDDTTTYYLYGMADSRSIVPESSETNNFTPLVQVTVQKPDLAITSLTASSKDLVPGGTVSLSYTLRNDGSASTPRSLTGYYLTTNTTFDPKNDIYIGADNPLVLAPGASVSRTSNLRLPFTVPTETYTLYAVADSPLQIPEKSETNNFFTLADKVTVRTPDLVISNLTAKGQFAANNTVSLSYTIKNEGQSLAGASITNYYLAKSSTSLDVKTDIFIGRDSLTAMSSGEIRTRASTLRLPTTLGSGMYYLYAVADGGLQITESNEDNNIIVSQDPAFVNISSPDLSIQNVTLNTGNVVNTPPLLTVGNTVNLGYKLLNTDSGLAGANTTTYYLSSDTVFDPAPNKGDIAIASDSITSLAGSSSVLRTNNGVRLSRTLATGTYYLYTVADASKTVPESSETNNITPLLKSDGTLQTVSVAKPDLTIPKIDSTRVFSPGGIASITYTLSNTLPNTQPVGTAPVTITRYYLSKSNTAYSPNTDIILGADSAPTLVGGASLVDRKISIKVPTTIADGTYYLYAMADNTNAAEEISENNNFSSFVPVTVSTADLVISNLTAKGQFAANNTVSLSYTIKNEGQSLAGASITNYYLAKSSTSLDVKTDIFIGRDSLTAMSSGEIRTRASTLRLPTTLGSGMYYLYAVADGGLQITESNEDNNIIVSQDPAFVNISSPDLSIQNVTLNTGNVVNTPPLLTVGNTVNLGYKLLNTDSGLAGANTTTYYLSSDTVFDPAPNKGDIAIASDSITSLAGSSSVLRTNNGVRLSRTLATGTYYLYTVADASKTVPESSETNNITPLLKSDGTLQTVSVAKPDLTIPKIDSTRVFSPGGIASITYTLSNTLPNTQPVGTAPVTITRYYLSKSNTAYSPNTDIILGADSAPTLVGGASLVDRKISIKVPTTIADGTYYLYAMADNTNAAEEISENNNFSSFVPVTVGYPDLTIQNFSTLPVPTLGTVPVFNAGTTTSVTYTVANLTSAPAAASLTQYYLSTDTTFDSTDRLVGGKTSIDLNGLGSLPSSVTETGTVTIPKDESLLEGNYFLLAVADSPKLIAETSEDNNVAATPITITKPDLIVNSVTVPNSIILGVQSLVTYTLKNQGSGNAGYNITRFYISTDETFDSNDPLVGAGAVPAVTINATATSRAYVTIPTNVGMGMNNLYLFAVADGTSLLAERSENNNVSTATPVSTTNIDLSIGNLSVPSVGGLNNAISISYTVSNVGNANSTASLSEFYLSTNTTLDSSDLLLSADTVLSVAAGQTVNANVAPPISTSIAPGNYYIIGVANASGGIPEVNRTNNTAYKAITLSSNDQTTNNGFNNRDGYGLVNAAVAVSKVLGQNPFPDVAQLGGNSWYTDFVKAPEVWNRGYKGQGITVAVIDTGVDYTHPDLAPNIWTNQGEIAGNGIDDDDNGFIDDYRGWNFVDDNNNVMDTDSHGTHVAGIIGATQNGVGTTGIAPLVKIMPIKVIGSSRTGSGWDVAQGIYYATNNGAKVINLSLGGSTPLPSIRDAIDYAASQGVNVVMAAGNSGGTIPVYPGYYALNNGIVVGAVDRENTFLGFSNRAGDDTAMAYVTAPGGGLTSTVLRGLYAGKSGTSMATPNVAGVVALMLSANPNLTPDEVRQIVTSSAVHTLITDPDTLEIVGTDDPTNPMPNDLENGYDDPSDIADLIFIQ